MLTIRLKTLIVSACVLNALWLLVAQTTGSLLLLLPCLGCFMALVMWSAFKKMALPVMLFFLPFSSLLKIRPNTITFYTLALLAAYLVYVVTSSRRVSVHHLVPALCLMALTIVVKTAFGHSLEYGYLLFCVTLLLVPYISAEFRNGCDFYWITTTFALGVVLAAITSQFLADSPNIMQYMNVLDALSFIRRSGYFNDPNFYAAHITAAIGGVLVLLLHRLRKKQVVTLVILLVLLIYSGLLSVSKSFVLVTLSMVLFWTIGLMFQRGKISIKLMVLLCALVGIYILFSSSMFDVVLSRFMGVTNVSALTTGRSGVWMNYLRELGDNPLILLFGNGYSAVTVGGRAAHNTLLQMVYQFGLVGCSVLVYWFVCFARTLLSGVRIHRTKLTQLAIVLVGAFGPWMGLDCLTNDEFYLFPIYVCVAVRFMAMQEQTESPLIE